MNIDYLTQVKPLEDSGKTDAEIAVVLNALTVEHRNTELQSIRAVRVKLGEPAAMAAAGGLQAAASQNPLLAAMWIAVSSTGIDFAAAETQDTIDQLTAASVWSAEIAAQLKALGIWHTSQAHEAIGRDATEPDVADSRAAYQSRLAIDTLQSDWVTLQNEGGINSALAVGARDALVIALRTAANSLEGE